MSTEITVEGMTCQGCEDVVETALKMVDDVDEAEADRYEDVAVVEAEVEPELLVSKVELAGYEGSA